MFYFFIPQMSPMLWLFIYFYIVFLLVLLMVMLYYFFLWIKLGNLKFNLYKKELIFLW